MSSNQVTRCYNFSDADLIQAANQQIRLMSRDMTQFAEYNYDSTKQAEFEAALDFFSNFPSDAIFEGDKMILTEQKNEARKKIENSMRDVQFIAKMAFDNKPAYIKAFGDLAISKQTDVDLLNTARTIQKSMIKFAQELAANGLSIIKTNQFDQAYQEFQTTFNAMNDAITERDIMTNDRIEAANKLYLLYSKYAQLGQHIWQQKNEAKYNDYVIYGATKTNTPDAEASSDII